MITNCKNILVLAPHTDDGELGLGGTISRLIEDGKKVTYVAFSTAQQSVPEGFPKDILKTEVKQATQTLGIEPENPREPIAVRWRKPHIRGGNTPEKSIRF